ncbi:gamma-glutamylcyclotransferase [Synechococcus sp. GreenBA-s]|nr:gamma-glutamylcyclotransferase [Synechococcus sp. GreenBA-s]
MAHNQHLDAEDASAPVATTARKPADHEPGPEPEVQPEPEPKAEPAALVQAAGPGAAGEPVFVYGTLQRGHSNHHWLAGAGFVGERQLGGARLFDLGPFPMAVAADADDLAAAADSAIAPIHGELYHVSAGGLAQLDRLEGCPRLYGRHWLQLLDGSHAWVYLGRPRQVRHARLLADGRWRGRAGMPP